MERVTKSKGTYVDYIEVSSPFTDSREFPGKNFTHVEKLVSATTYSSNMRDTRDKAS